SLFFYFSFTKIILDESFYNYSWADVSFILRSSGIPPWVVILLITGMLALFYFFLAKRTKEKNQAAGIKIIFSKFFFLPVIILTTLLHQQLINAELNGNESLAIRVNKSFYFLDRSLKYFSKH